MDIDQKIRVWGIIAVLIAPVLGGLFNKPGEDDTGGKGGNTDTSENRDQGDQQGRRETPKPDPCGNYVITIPKELPPGELSIDDAPIFLSEGSIEMETCGDYSRVVFESEYMYLKTTAFKNREVIIEPKLKEIRLPNITEYNLINSNGYVLINDSAIVFVYKKRKKDKVIRWSNLDKIRIKRNGQAVLCPYRGFEFTIDNIFTNDLKKSLKTRFPGLYFQNP